MNFNIDRLQVLSGIKDADNGGARLISESTEHDNLTEQKIRQIIREEIKSYLNEQNATAMAKGFRGNNLTAAMGFAGPGFQPTNKKNRSFARGPGRAIGFGGPGFM